MGVKVIVIGLLKNYTEGKTNYDLPSGMPISEMIQTLKIPSELVAGVFINDRGQPKDYVPCDGDTVKLIAVIGGGCQEE
jgi:sulfur carrier protein ThiS